MTVRVDKPGTVLMYRGQLARVVGVGEGRSLVLDLVDAPVCPTCGEGRRVHLLESSPLFQDNVAPVETIEAP